MKRRFRVAAAGLAWSLGAIPAAFAQGTPPPSIIPRTEAVASTSAAGATNPGRNALEAVPSTLGPKAIAKVLGAAAPGLRVRLDGSPSSGGQVWYRWVQSAGTRVTLAGADQPVAQFVVPEGADSLGFVLVVGNASGVDARPVDVEVVAADSEGELVPLKADAGADQVANVGHRVVLDGAKSEPRGKIRLRWVQTAGPKPVDLAAHGTTCQFIPEVTGNYQFALLAIGEDGLVSEAAPVAIKVRPAQAGSVVGSPTRPTSIPTERTAPALDELARSALASIPGSSRLAPDLARAFDAAAERVESAKTYLDAATDLTRRLDVVVPRDPSRRAEWVARFLKPWNNRMIEIVRDNGLDLEQPGGQTKPLTKSQKSRLAEQFRVTAAGLRAGLSLR